MRMFLNKFFLQIVITCACPFLDGLYAQCPKITAIYKEYTYDLRGYENEGGGNPYGLVNGLYDPKNGIVTQGGRLDSIHLKASIHVRTKSYNYNSNLFGSEIDFDLKVNYTLKEIFFYEWGYTPDSMYILAGDWNKWDTLVRHRTSGNSNTWGWKKFVVNDTVHKIRVSFPNAVRDQYSALAEITEMVFYGCPLSTPPLPPLPYSGSRQPVPTVKDFVWINTWKEIDSINWWKPFGGVRIYKHRNWYDTARLNTFPIKRYVDKPFGVDLRAYAAKLKAIGVKMYVSYFEVPQYIKTAGGGHRDFVTDVYGQNPRNPNHYRTDSMFFRNRVNAYKYVMKEVQIGNEENQWVAPGGYEDPVIAAARTIKVYQGIKKADPYTKVIMSPYTKPDTNALKVQYYALRMLGDGRVQYYDGGIAYHQYIFGGQNEFPATEVYNPNLHGELPEVFGMLPRLRKIREATYRIAGNTPMFIDEFGWSRTQNKPFRVPIIPGLDPANSQGCVIVKALNYGLFAGVDRMAIYWMVNDVGDGNGGIFDAMGLMDAPPPAYKEIPFDSYYWIATYCNTLAKYKPVSFDTSGAVWMFKYRHSTRSDSAAYFIASKDFSQHNVLIVGKGKVVDFPGGKAVPVNGNIVVGYVPRLVFVKEY